MPTSESEEELFRELSQLRKEEEALFADKENKAPIAASDSKWTTEDELFQKLGQIQKEKTNLSEIDSFKGPATLSELVEEESTLLKMMKQDVAKTSNSTVYAPLGGNEANTVSDNFETPLPSFQELSLKDRYQILEEMASGGMGKIQRAWDSWLEREVALKRIYEEKFSSQSDEQWNDTLWRFYREAKITAMLEHPNIIPLHNIQRNKKGEIYFTLRIIQGDTLTEILRKKKAGDANYDERKIISIFFKVCDAIAYAHSKNIIHRDLKPDNVMIGTFGEVYVIDWGVAKRVGNSSESTHSSYEFEPGQTIGNVGTLEYMPPEQAKDPNFVQIQSDIYALGKILRQCFLQLSPSEEAKMMETKATRKKLASEIAEKIPYDIQVIVQKSTEIQWQKRYPFVTTLKKDIERYQKKQRISSREYSLFESMVMWRKRNTKLVLSLLLLFLISCFLFIYTQRIAFNEKEKLFQDATQKALVSLKLAKENSGKMGEQMKALLSSFHFFKVAFTLKPQKEIATKRHVVGKEIMRLAYGSQDYQLAAYIAKELQHNDFLSENEKEKIQDELTVAQSKTAKEHHQRFRYRINQLKATRQSEMIRKDAIFEIAKMKEEEIFQELILLLNQGNNYITQSSERSLRLDEFYQTIILILSYSENPKAAESLMQSLEFLSQQQLVASPLSKSDLEYLLLLAQSLKMLDFEKEKFQERFIKIREKFLPTSLFWKETLSLVEWFSTK